MSIRKPNILQINSGDKGGGAHLVAWELMEGLEKDGYHNRMIVGTKLSDKVNISEIGKSKILLYLNLLFGTEFLLLGNSIRKITKIIDLNKIDIIHCHNLHGYYFNLKYFPYLCKLKPVLWTFHDMWPILGHSAHSLDCKICESGNKCSDHMSLYPKLYTWDSSHWLFEIKRKILTSSNFEIVVPSLWLKHKIENSFLGKKKIHLVRNGIDTNVYKKMPKKACRKELGIPEDKTVLLFVASGGLDNTWKGVDKMIALIKDYRDQNGVQFIIIGGDKIAAEGSVRYIPFIKEKNILAKYYSSADIFLMPSVIENLPLVSLEAMACGTPVVAFDVGGVGEEINHKIDGYLAKPGSYLDFKKGVEWMLSDLSRLNGMDKIVSNKVKKYFSKRTMVKQYEKIYNRILEK